MALKHSSLLLALLMGASLPALEHEFSGLLDFYIEAPMHQKGASGTEIPESERLPGKMLSSRARLRWDFQMAKHWYSHVQIQKPEYNNAQLGFLPFDEIVVSSNPNAFEISQAYMNYQWGENIDFRFGKVPVTAISVAQMGYQSPIGDEIFHRSSGSVFCQPADGLGLTVEATVGPIRFELTAWQQSQNRRLWDLPDHGAAIGTAPNVTTLSEAAELLAGTANGLELTDFRGNNITLSYAGRLALVYNTRPNTHWGIGMGYSLQQLNMPIVIACIGAYDATPGGGNYIPPNYQMMAYNRLIEFGLDTTRTYKWWLFQVGYQYQRLRVENSQHYYYQQDDDPNASPSLAAESASATQKAQAFDNNGLAHAWWLQTGCLLLGDSYIMDIKDGSVAGIETSPKYGALELYTRVGIVHRHNALALLTESGVIDLSTYDKLEPLQPASPALAATQTVTLDEVSKYLLVTIDNTGAQTDATVLTPLDDISYRSHEHSYLLGLSYALTRSSQFKIEYQITKRSFDKEQNKSWLDDLYAHCAAFLRLRWESKF